MTTSAHGNYRPLSRVLIRRIIVLATACALLLSAVQGVLTYLDVQQRFHASLHDIVSSNLPMLSVGIWDIEPEAVKRQVDAIAAKPEIGYVRLNVSTGQSFEAGQASLLRHGTIQRFDVPPPHDDGQMLGNLLIVAQPALLYQSLLRALLTILLGYLLLTVLICALVIYVLRREVERPLRSMADFASQLSPAQLTRPLQLARKPRAYQDEIDLVASGFATLQSAITRHIETLDQQVAQRTVQLDRALHDIRELSIHDALTGCYNRVLLNERLPGEIERAQRYQRVLSVVFCDVDHFKRVNDRYGHLAGDEVLRVLAQRLQSQLRQGTDWIVRFGGEEFLIVQPETERQAAMHTAERLREAIATSLTLPDGQTLQVTASFGVASLMPDDNMITLLGRADEQLYRAKDAGRDCIRG